MSSSIINIRRGELRRLFRHRGVSEIDVHNAVEDLLAEHHRWTAMALGLRVDLSFNDKIRLGIKTIACIDRTKKMMKLYFRERKRERDRKRAQEIRAHISGNNISPRATQLSAVLGNQWTESRTLAAIMKNRWRLKPDAMRQAMRRTCQELTNAGIAELKYQAGSRGSRALFLRRKNPMDIDVSEDRRARNTDKIRLLR